ncbi:MAG: hypothetical protein ACYSTZ_09020 [Planctomycetota bacterium]|jgi:hypothetical protein
MLFQRISRANPEKVFIVCKNGYSTAALTNGQPVMWDMGDADGVNVTQPSAAFKRGSAFAGIVAETIAVSGYGLVQVYGYHSAVIVDSSTTADIYTGAPLYMSVAAFNLEGPYLASGTTDEVYFDLRPVACALEAYGSVGTTGTIKAQIFAL